MKSFLGILLCLVLAVILLPIVAIIYEVINGIGAIVLIVFIIGSLISSFKGD